MPINNDDFHKRRAANLAAMEQARMAQEAKKQKRRDEYLEALQIERQIDRGELIDTYKVADMTGLYPRKILRWEKQGKVPKSIRYGKLHYWDASEIEQWIRDNG